MNGYAQSGLDEDAFGEKSSNNGVLRTFDAFPKTKASYTRRSAGGGYATVFLVLFSALMCVSELRNWWTGTETQMFSVEKGVSHVMQINLDAVVKMKCDDLHLNVQDASGDRIVASELLKRDPTSWRMWNNPRFMHLLGQERSKYGPENEDDERDAAKRLARERADTHAGHVLGEVRRGKRKFPKTPRMPKGVQEDACRIYGSLEGNKVQGDFHITARGHGYQEFGQHLAHDTFNFSHIISELSFGPLYPELLNPLDNTVNMAESHFHRFQYYLSVVPTIYTSSARAPSPYAPAPPSSAPADVAGSTDFALSRDAVRTNQYAVTSQSGEVEERYVPGIFFKYDIEPILLTIVASRGGFLALTVRVINAVSGVLVGGGWIYQLWGWGRDVGGYRGRARAKSEGMLHGRHNESDHGD